VNTTYDRITGSKQDSAPTTLFIFSGAEDSQYVAERLIRSVCLIPGATEFGYGTTTVRKTDGSIHENSYAGGEITDLVRSMEQLIERAPNLGHVSLVVAWHGTDLRIGNCEIKPKVDRAVKDTIPYSWQVGPTTRANAEEVSYTGGFPAAGGAPSDRSVYEAITWLKARGLEVTLYPFIFMDVESGNSLPNPYGGTGQPAYPWRGRITCDPAPGQPGTVDQTAAAAAQVSNFFGTVDSTHFGWDEVNQVVTYTGPATEWSFRRHILHLATIADAAGADDFLIGTEMVEMNRIRSARDVFPAVNELVSLLGQVRNIVGSDMKVSYAADWSEWNGYRPPDGTGDVWFHLDPLWSDSRITYIGIDNYMKTADWRDGDDHLDALEGWPSIYDLNYQRGNIRGGEDYDWFYASQVDRDNQTRTPISDGAYNEPWVYRQKDLWNWWSNEHFNRYTPEPYIYTTELGEAEGYVEATFTCSEKIIKGPTTIVIDLTSISNNCAVQLYSARYGVSFSNYERIFTSDVNVVGQSTNAIHLEYEVPDEIPYLNYIFTLFLYKPGGGLRLHYVDVVFKPIASGGEFSSYIDDNGLEWRVHKFTAVNFVSPYHNGVNPEPTVQNFIVNTDIKARFLVVGGGARGADATTASTKVVDGISIPETDGIGTSGAGSAGEAVEYKNINLAPDTYEVQVGQAGGWKPFDGAYPANGSRFDYLETLGGNSGETNYSEFVSIRTGGDYPSYEYAWTISTKAGAGGEYPGAGGGDNPEPATVSVGHLFSNLTRTNDVYGDRWKMKFASGSGGGGAGGPGQLGSVIANEVNSQFYWDQPFNVMDMPEGGAGGPGIVSDITGEPVTYAEGGRGGGPTYWDPTSGSSIFSGYSNAPPSTYGSGGVGGFAVNSQNNHYVRGGDGQHGVVIVSYPVEKPSPWVPESKPIVFTELGCPAVSRGPNQPNVFVDPKSSENSLPYYSLGVRDDMAQRSFLEASLSFWENEANNPQSSVYSGRMLDNSRTSIWAWDARPFPDFPDADDFWGDAPNWELGHWINGRIEQPQALAGTMDTFRYTDSDKPITFGGNVYDPLPVKPGKVKQDGGLERVSFQITVPRNAGIAALLREFRPAHSMVLTVLQGQATDGTGLFVPRWHGRITSTKRKGEQLEIVGIPSAAALSRAGLTRNYQIGCPHVLYGPMCKADRDAATRTGTISSITGDQITLNSGWEGSFAKDKYITGVVEWTRSNSRIERRRILAVAGETLTLSGPPTELAPTDTVSVILGCNQTVFDCVDLHNNIHNCGACPTIPNKNPLASEANNFY
jgi:hypothetical protein